MVPESLGGQPQVMCKQPRVSGISLFSFTKIHSPITLRSKIAWIGKLRSFCLLACVFMTEHSSKFGKAVQLPSAPRFTVGSPCQLSDFHVLAG